MDTGYDIINLVPNKPRFFPNYRFRLQSLTDSIPGLSRVRNTTDYHSLKIFQGIVIKNPVKIFSAMAIFNPPTLRLLNSSTIVAISGALRLHVAFLLAGITPLLAEYLAFSLIVYATYTLDRSLGCKEDSINRSDLAGAERTAGIIACSATFIVGTVILVHDGIWVAPFFPLVIGYIYSHGIRIGNRSIRFKGGTGVKNTVIGITWGGTMALIAGQWCASIITVSVIFLFFSLKVFITSCVNDFKDIEGDMAAGIRTLPACLGERRTKTVLIAILLGSYGILLYALLHSIIQDEWVLISTGFLIMFVFLLIYTPSFERNSGVVFRKMREVAISWEAAIGLALRACVAV
jgi:4-hydroxybenzoate polyprenyltransferase